MVVRCLKSFKIKTVAATDYPLQYEWLDAEYCAYFADDGLFEEQAP